MRKLLSRNGLPRRLKTGAERLRGNARDWSAIGRGGTFWEPESCVDSPGFRAGFRFFTDCAVSETWWRLLVSNGFGRI